MTTIQNLVDEGFILFTFAGISTYINNVGDEKKKPLGMPTWKNITNDNFVDFIKETDKGVALITGSMSGITVIDFDDINVYNQLLLECPEIKNIRTIKTKNGIHLYCKYDKNIKTTTNALIGYDKIDIRNDDAIIFCPPTKYRLINGSYAEYVDMGGEILPVPIFLSSKMKQNNITIKINEIKEIKKEIKELKDETVNNLKFIENCLDCGYLNFKATSKSYEDWRDVGFIFKHTSQCDKAFELFCRFSQINDILNPSDKPLYDKDYTKMFWKSIKQLDDKNPLTIKTLKSWKKEQIAKSAVTFHFCSSDKEAGDYLYEIIKDNLVYCQNTLYYKKNNIWINDEKELKISLRDYVLSSHVYKENTQKALLPYAQNVSNAKNIVDVIIGIVVNKTDNSFYEKFLTTTKTKICFNNGVLNLKTKEFTLWKNITKENEVFSTFVISRDFNPIRNEDTIKLIKTEIFEKIFNTDAQRALNFYSRAMAGHVEDKVWGLFIGSRNCGKGVLENFFKQTFQRYITTVNAEVFLCERISDGGDSAKKLSWMLDLEFSRLTFTQECKFDNTNKNVKIDGNKIKKLASGGDTINARKNFKDEREFKTQTTLTFNANDFPPISPIDTMETCTSFSSTKQFKTQEFINQRKSEGALDLELKMYDVADAEIKSKCSTTLWTDSLIHLIMDNYVSKSVTFVNKFLDDNDDTNLITKILTAFEITKNKEDKVTNDELKNWCESNGISLGNKLKPYLKGWGCSDYKSMSKRGLQGIKIIKKIEIIEVIE
jgi:hypothetical protein